MFQNVGFDRHILGFFFYVYCIAYFLQLQIPHKYFQNITFVQKQSIFATEVASSELLPVEEMQHQQLPTTDSRRDDNSLSFCKTQLWAGGLRGGCSAECPETVPPRRCCVEKMQPSPFITNERSALLHILFDFF